jgi:tetratricopeptide (TPR) repeat protein
MIRLPSISLIFCLLVSPLLADARPSLREGLPGGSLDATWRDPDFVRSFIGSFGFLSGLEPTVSAEERDFLQTVLDTIQRDPEQAIRLLQQNLRSDSSAAFDFILGNLQFQTDRLSAAADSYRNAIRKFPDFRRAHKNLGLLRLRQNDYPEAIRHLSRAMELGDVDGRSFGLLGYAHLQLGQPFPASIAYRQATLLQPTTTDWQIGLVQSLMQTGRANEAIAVIDHLLQKQPERGDLWLLQANAWLSLDNPQQAAMAIEMAHRLGNARERSLLLLGDIYFREGLSELALDNYMAALDKAGDNLPSALVRAVDLFQRRHDDQRAATLMDALTEREDALTREQRQDLLRMRARRAEREGDLEQARDWLEALIAASGLNGNALIELARVHQQMGETEQAINRLEQARLIPASERNALIALARLKVAENQPSHAIPLLRRALQIQHEPALEAYLERLERNR